MRLNEKGYRCWILIPFSPNLPLFLEGEILLRKYPWRWSFDFLLGVLLIAAAIFLNFPPWLKIFNASAGSLLIIVFALIYANDRKKNEG